MSKKAWVVWDEEPQHVGQDEWDTLKTELEGLQTEWDALRMGLPPGGQSGQVLVFSAQLGDWKWAPCPDAPLAAEKVPDEGTVRRSVADFLRGGLRNIDADMVNPENRDNSWRQGYQAASKQLSRDLCRHLDIAWDDKANEPKKGA